MKDLAHCSWLINRSPGGLKVNSTKVSQRPGRSITSDKARPRDAPQTKRAAMVFNTAPRHRVHGKHRFGFNELFLILFISESTAVDKRLRVESVGSGTPKSNKARHRS